MTQTLVVVLVLLSITGLVFVVNRNLKSRKQQRSKLKEMDALSKTPFVMYSVQRRKERERGLGRFQ